MCGRGLSSFAEDTPYCTAAGGGDGERLRSGRAARGGGEWALTTDGFDIPTYRGTCRDSEESDASTLYITAR